MSIFKGCLLINLLLILLALMLLSAAAFGIYCCFVPDAWNRSVTRVAEFWDNTKSGGDRVVDNSWGKVKKGGDRLIDSVPRGEKKSVSDAPKGE